MSSALTPLFGVTCNADYLKTNAPAKGIGSPKEKEQLSGAALIGGKGWFGKGKNGKSGKGGGKGLSGLSCFRCWAKDDHLSGQCGCPPGVCTACGMDSDKARLSCGGEQDPTTLTLLFFAHSVRRSM